MRIWAQPRTLTAKSYWSGVASAFLAAAYLTRTVNRRHRRGDDVCSLSDPDVRQLSALFGRHLHRDAAAPNCANQYMKNLAKCPFDLPSGLDPLQAVLRWRDAIWIDIDRML